MKKFFSTLAVAMILCSTVYADKILKSGYLIPTKKWADKIDINKILVSIPLIITYLIGPIGLFIYWIIRIFYAKRMSLYE